MHTPINKLIVKLEKKLYDSRTFESGQTIHFDPSWHPEEFAMLKANVVTVPPSIMDRHDYAGYSAKTIYPGDEVLIRYDVVFSYHDQPDRDTPIYKNLVFHFNDDTSQFEELWFCDILQVFAVIRCGQYIMLNGFIMLDIITERKSGYSDTIITPDSYKNQQLKHMAIVHAGGWQLGLNPGNTVFINPQTVMKYQLNLKEFYIIKDKYILALLR